MVIGGTQQRRLLVVLVTILVATGPTLPAIAATSPAATADDSGRETHARFGPVADQAAQQGLAETSRNVARAQQTNQSHRQGSERSATTDNATLSGVVLDSPTGQPVSDARVIIAGNETTYDRRTGQTGTYRLSVPRGEYAVQVCAPGYGRNATRLVVDDEYERQDVVLEPLFAGGTVDVDGVVQDIQVNVPLSSASVSLRATRLDMPTGRVNLSANESIDQELQERLASASNGTGACASQAADYTTITEGETLSRSPGDDGAFAFRNLPPGRYVVSATAPNHQRTTITLPRSPDTGTPNGTIRSSRTVRFYLKGPTVNASGSVMGWKPTDDGRERVPLGKFDVNASLVRPGERLLYGPLHDGYVESGNDSVETGESATGFPLGRYEFASFPTGADIPNTEYRVSAWSAGYNRTSETRALTPGSPIDFTLDYVNSSASVDVVSPAYHDDAGDPLPVDGARVRLVGKPGDAAGDNVPATEGVELSARTGADGTVTFDGVPPGRYTVVVQQRTLIDGEARATFPRRELTLRIDPGAEASRRVELYPELGRLNGQLMTFDDPIFHGPVATEFVPGTRRTLPNTSWDGFTYQPLPWANVSVDAGSFRGFEVNDSLARMTSGPNGVYGGTFPPGTYDLTARKEGYLDTPFEAHVSSGEASDPVTRVAPAEDYFYGVVIMGVDGMTNDSRIFNERGPPAVNPPGIHLLDSPVISQGGGYGVLRNATLTFESATETFEVEADDSGRFVLPAVPRGEYTVIVEHPDLQGASILPEPLVSQGSGRLRSLVATAQPYATSNTSLTVWNIPPDSDAYVASRSYVLDGFDSVGKLRTRSVESEGGEPVQIVPIGRPFSMVVSDRRDGSLGFCTVGMTPDDTDVVFNDNLESPDCSETTTEVREFAGHVYGNRSWEPLDNASVTLYRRTQSGGFTEIETVTTGPDGRYRIASPIVNDYPIGEHRLVVDHPTIDETTFEVFSSVPGTTRRDLYVEQKYQAVSLSVVDQEGDPVPNATVTFDGEDLRTAERFRVSTGADGVARIGVETTFEGRIELGIRADGYYPANATTAELTLTDPADPVTLGTVTTEALPAPAVTLVGIEWASDAQPVGTNTHVLSGISDPDKPERTAVRMDIETDRLANLGDGPTYDKTGRIATVEAPYADDLSDGEWLRQHDPVESLVLDLRQEDNGTEAVLQQQFFQQTDRDPKRWRTRIDLADLPPSHYVESTDFDTEQTVVADLQMLVDATTRKGGSGSRASTLAEEEIFINRPPALYSWIYSITGGTTAEPPIPFGFDTVSTKGLTIPSRGRAGADIGTDQDIQRTPTGQLTYAITQHAMFEFAWHESADSLKELATASKKWGVKAAANTTSVVDIDSVRDDVDGSVSLSFSLPDKGFLSSDLVGGSVSGELSVAVDNHYQLPPTPNLSTEIVQGRLAVTGELDGTANLDVGQATATLLGGPLAQKIVEGLSETGAAKITATVKGGPKATVGLEIDERLFPYDMQVESFEDLQLGGDFGVQLKGTLGMGAATSQANASLDARVAFDQADGSLDLASGTLRGEAGSSITLLGYTLWEVGTRGIITRQEFGTEGQAFVLERRERAGPSRAYASRSDYAVYHGEDGVVLATGYRFARPAVAAGNGSAHVLFGHDSGEEEPPESFSLRVSEWGEWTTTAGPATPEPVVDERVVDGDIAVTGARTVIAASTIDGEIQSAYPVAYLDQSEIRVRSETADGRSTETITDNDYMEVSPRVNGDLIVWTVDRDGLPWTLSDRQLRYARHGDGSVQQPRVLANVSVVAVAVSDHSAGHSRIAAVVDADGNPWTTQDRALRQFTWSGDGVVSTTLADSGAVETPATANGVTAWSDGNRVRVSLDDQPVETQVTGREIQGVTAEHLRGDPVVTWAERRHSETVFRAAIHRSGSWRGPITLERVEANVSDYETALLPGSARIAGTYTVPGNGTGTRTVRYLSGDLSPLAIGDGNRSVGISLDVEPGDANNEVRNETITVAVLGSDTFDADRVVGHLETARFGTYRTVADGGGIEPMAMPDEEHISDVDGDGTADLLLRFERPENRTAGLSYLVVQANETTYVGADQIGYVDVSEETPTPTTPGETTTVSGATTQPTGAGSDDSDSVVLLGLFLLAVVGVGAFLWYRRGSGS